MGRIIAVTNIKGGIGKTTTVVNIGAGLARKGLRVLLVDCDAQGNVAIALGVTAKRTIYDVLVDNADPRHCIIAARPNLFLLAADESLLGAQTVVSRRADWARVLELSIRPLRQEYDVILVDSPGSLTILSVNALIAAQEIIVPTTVEHLSIKGLAMLFKQVARITTGSSIIRSIVPTMFDPRLSQSHVLLKQLQQTYGKLVVAPVRINVRLSEATSYGKTIYEYDAQSRGALDYAQLVEHLVGIWGYIPSREQTKYDASAITTPQAMSNVPSPVHPIKPATPDTLNAAVTPSSTSVHSMPMPTPTPPARTSSAAVLSTAQPNQHVCPQCGNTTRISYIAGYRIIYCESCKYKQQEVATDIRRA